MTIALAILASNLACFVVGWWLRGCRDRPRAELSQFTKRV